MTSIPVSLPLMQIRMEYPTALSSRISGNKEDTLATNL
jgi:hypothetical protein